MQTLSCCSDSGLDGSKSEGVFVVQLLDGVVVVIRFIENLRLMNEGKGRRKGKPWCCWVHQGDVMDREKERRRKGKQGYFGSIHMK